MPLQEIITNVAARRKLHGKNVRFDLCGVNNRSIAGEGVICDTYMKDHQVIFRIRDCLTHEYHELTYHEALYFMTIIICPLNGKPQVASGFEV